jgi:hypothetical protein
MFCVKEKGHSFKNMFTDVLNLLLRDSLKQTKLTEMRDCLLIVLKRETSVPETSERAVRLRSLLCSGYRSVLQGVRWPERGVDRLTPSSTGIKNEWSCTSTLPTYLHSVERNTVLLPKSEPQYYESNNESQCV